MTMIERVARAMYARAIEERAKSDLTLLGSEITPWDGLTHWERGERVAIARAAIEAMREPTEAMVFAGVVHLVARQDGDAGRLVDAMWPLMIDAALAGEDGT